MPRATWLALYLVSLGALCPALTAAQSDIDTVRLHGGGFVRGHIVEYVPDEFVRIELAGDEIRRIAATEIASINEAPALRPPPPPAVAAPVELGVPAAAAEPDAETVGIRFDPTSAGLVLHRRNGFAGDRPTYETVCRPPCLARLPRGDHELAVSVANNRPVQVPHLISLETDGRARVDFVDRRGHRTFGWVLAFVGGTAGAGVGTVGMFIQFRCCGLTELNALVAGPSYAVMLGSVIAGVVLWTQGDEALVELTQGEPLALRF